MEVKAFNGLNNVDDPLNLGLSWLVRADNINITAAGRMEKRQGYSKHLAAVVPPQGAYTTIDHQHGYYVDAGSLKTFDGAVLRAGLTMANMHWAEVNGQVFFTNGIDSGTILPDNSVIPWSWPVPAAPTLRAVTGDLAPGLYRACCTYTLADGRETGPSEVSEFILADGQALQLTGIPQPGGAATNIYISSANSTVLQWAGSPTGSAMTWNASPDDLGAELQTKFMRPLPDGCGPIQFWRGRAYAAQYMPAASQTVVWFSQPLGFHLFNLAEDFIVLPGQVHMLAPHDDGLLIGTSRAVHAYTGDALVDLADYGVVPGHHWAEDGTRTLFWTKRGLCAALPFNNLTEGQVSVAPGLSAGGTVVHSGGQKRYVVALKQGGQAFNPYP